MNRPFGVEGQQEMDVIGHNHRSGYLQGKPLGQLGDGVRHGLAAVGEPDGGRFMNRPYGRNKAKKALPPGGADGDEVRAALGIVVIPQTQGLAHGQRHYGSSVRPTR